MLAQGSGYSPVRPPKPQPSFSYSAMAPSGPYASPHPQPVQMRGPQPGSLAVPYGYDPMSQSGQSIQVPGTGVVNTPRGPMTMVGGRMVPKKSYTGPQPIDEYYAQMGNLIRGGRPADPTTKGHMDSAKFAAGLIAMLAPPSAIESLGARGAVKAASEAPSMIDRIVGGSSAPVQNPELLGQLGRHADLAEAVIANKAFDKELAMSQRQAMLKNYSLGALLRGEQPPTLGLQYGFERRKFPR